jgi:hypothetical protein
MRDVDGDSGLLHDGLDVPPSLVVGEFDRVTVLMNHRRRIVVHFLPEVQPVQHGQHASRGQLVSLRRLVAADQLPGPLRQAAACLLGNVPALPDGPFQHSHIASGHRLQVGGSPRTPRLLVVDRLGGIHERIVMKLKWRSAVVFSQVEGYYLGW